MKPKIPKSVKKPLPASARPKTSPSSKPETKKASRPGAKSKPKTALDHVERKSSTRRLNKFIAERNSALDSLQDIENKYEKLFAVHSDGILLFDVETKIILDANNSACNLFGYSKEELTQLTITDISAEPEQTLDQLEKIIKDKLKKIRYDTSKPNQATKSQPK